MNKSLPSITLLAIALLASGCTKKQEEQKKGPPPALITVAQSGTRTMQVLEQSIGEADSATAPKVGAEVTGRIIKVYVEIGDAVKKGQLLAEIDPTDYSADAKRLEAQAVTQQKLAERYRDLSRKGFISPSALESYDTQNVVAREQYARAAKNLARTRIVSPVDGQVDNRMVSVGDWIDLGKPAFQLSTSKSLRISLPFPESVLSKIKPGMKALLSSPADPDKPVEGRVKEIRPTIGSSNRSSDAVIEIINPGNWKPGASVNGAVVIAEHPDAVVVPETSVVLRPAGTVVYVIKDQHAAQVVVQTGVKQAGQVEILSGLKAGETVALDGAGYLADKATVAVRGDKK